MTIIDDFELAGQLSDETSDLICILPSPELVRRYRNHFGTYLISRAEEIRSHCGDAPRIQFAIPMITSLARAMETQASIDGWYTSSRASLEALTGSVDLVVVNPTHESAITAEMWALGGTPLSPTESLVTNPSGAGSALLIHAFLERLRDDSGSRVINARRLHPAVNQELWHYLVLAATLQRLSRGRVFADLWTDTPNFAQWRQSQSRVMDFDSKCTLEPALNLQRDNSRYQMDLGFPHWLQTQLDSAEFGAPLQRQLLRYEDAGLGDPPGLPSANSLRPGKCVVVDANFASEMASPPGGLWKHLIPEAMIQVPTTVSLEVARKAIFWSDTDPTALGSWRKVQPGGDPVAPDLKSSWRRWRRAMGVSAGHSTRSLSASAHLYLRGREWRDRGTGVGDVLFAASCVDAIDMVRDASNVLALTDDTRFTTWLSRERPRLHGGHRGQLKLLRTIGQEGS